MKNLRRMALMWTLMAVVALRWYVCLQCDVPDAPQLALALDPMGIDLGLTDQIACSDDVKYSRANLTRQYEDDLTMAQRGGRGARNLLRPWPRIASARPNARI